MAVLEAAIQFFLINAKVWMAGLNPAITAQLYGRMNVCAKAVSKRPPVIRSPGRALSFGTKRR
jgi:hypothetical protein